MTNEHAQHSTSTTGTGHLTLSVADLYCVSCAEQLEATLRANPHIISAHVDFSRTEIHVQFHPGMIDEVQIRALLNDSGRCTCAGGDNSADMTHLHHRAQMAPITMGTTHDRMQYELPSSGAHATHEAEHGKAMSHAGMDHDMADPRMAKAMEADMRNRFFVALLLTIPTVLYSPLGTDLFNIDLPTGPFNHNWIMLVLSTPVVWWAGWIFVGGAFRSLRHRSLNMSVLVATGVLAAWGFSVVITLGGLGETFFEAAAMLVTFVLFGHWMEMKSRRGIRSIK